MDPAKLHGEDCRHVCLSIPGPSPNGCPVFFSYYGIGQEDDVPGAKDNNGTFAGGRSFWGTIGLVQKTFGLTHHEALWGDSWINILLKMRDMPYYRTKTDEEKEKEHTHEGTVDVLKEKFAKYIKP